MNFQGIVIAIITFGIIGIFHPVVIKTEYYLGTKTWPFFAVLGCIALAGSVLCEDVLIQAILGVLGCSLFWCIVELFAQKKRVEKGWFPKRPLK